jgi:hypothetical protein
MTRAEKRAKRAAERLDWRKRHGWACVCCTADLDDDDLIEDANPREPRVCIDCCSGKCSGERGHRISFGDWEEVPWPPEGATP